jgi:ACS family 4-hydroxyphenylacetate permease-like MFS transporter
MAKTNTQQLPGSMVGTHAEDAGEAAVVRKVFHRLMWFLFLISAISYLDRINISYAALSMNKTLGLTGTTYGLATTIFYVGYVICEVPSNVLLAKFGARMWLSRIMITWGIVSAATMFIYDETSLYVMRFILGVAEAGLTPGVLLFLTFWFPRKYRARATGYFIIALALAVVTGSMISGLILKMPPYFGLENWRWLFLIEGLPATFFGLFGLYYLSDNPQKATWLTTSEKAILQRAFDRDEAAAKSVEVARSGSIWRQMLRKESVLLGLAYFGLVTTISANSSWVPLIVKELMSKYSISDVAFMTAIPPTIAILVLFAWGRSSDRTRERVWHTIAAFVVAAVGWMLVGYAAGPEIRFLGLVLCAIGAWCGMTIFWTLPPLLLPEQTRPTCIAFINSVGLLASALTPSIIGILRDRTGTFTIGVSYASIVLVIAIALILFVTGPKKATFG